jgi:hypothetical protein
LMETVAYFKWHIERGSGPRDESRRAANHVSEAV